MSDAGSDQAALIRDLEAKVAALEAFTSLVAHDLQAPARRMLSFAELLERELGRKLEPPASDYLAFINESATRLRALVSALLGFCETGAVSAEVVAVEPDQVVQGVRDDLAEVLREAGATINAWHLPKVLANGPLLGLVFAELLTNAVTFRGPEPLVIEIRGSREGDMVLLTVQDNGRGVDAAYHASIFEPLRRAAHDGLALARPGLGLATVRRVIERLEGSVEVSSTPGSGATFSLRLPAADR